MTTDLRITGVRITPVAFREPALLHAAGVHDPFVLRAIVEVDTADGLVGLGETYADERHLRRLRAAADAISCADVYALGAMYRKVAEALAHDNGPDGSGLTGMLAAGSAVDRVFSPFEVACLDIQGKAAGRPVSDLLGGAVRDRVPFGACLFPKWAGHPGAEPDGWGEALDPDAIVAQAHRMVQDHGFSAIKLKGGVRHPEEEIQTVLALRDAFPGVPLRLDTDAAWSVDTSIQVARRLEGVLEYLEDPTPGLDGMAHVARETGVPLATDLCGVALGHLAPSVERRSVAVVLADHHHGGGLHRSRLLAGICDTFGMGLSMHSHSHLGVSLAAMTHLAAATPDLPYACDTHWPWKTEEVVVPGVLSFADGAVRVPGGPGLGVELDRDALARLHEQYIVRGLRNRDGTGHPRRTGRSHEKKTSRR